MTRKKKILLVSIIIGFISLIFCCLITLVLLTVNPELLEEYELDDNGGAHDQTVAVISVYGLIERTETVTFLGDTLPSLMDTTIEQLDRAQKDNNVKAIILRIDSPGGTAYASRLLYNKILDVKEDGKPVIALLEDTAASGGYYIAAPADKIIASQTTLTGSIGVVISSLDTDELYKKIGIEEVYVTNSNGEFKVIDNLGNPESEDYKMLSRLLDDTYDQFIDVVASGRNMNRTEVITLADGSVYSGKRAMELGLVDELGEMAEAKAAAKEAADLDSPRFVSYHQEESTFSFTGMQFWQLVNKTILSGQASQIEVMYLMQ